MLFNNVSCLQIQMRCKIRAGGSGVIINEAEKPHRLIRDHETMHHLLQICNASLPKQHNPEGQARGPPSEYQHCKDTLIHFTAMRANTWSQDVSADDVTRWDKSVMTASLFSCMNCSWTFSRFLSHQPSWLTGWGNTSNPVTVTPGCTVLKVPGNKMDGWTMWNIVQHGILSVLQWIIMISWLFCACQCIHIEIHLRDEMVFPFRCEVFVFGMTC